MKKTDRAMLKQIIVLLDRAVSVDSIDVSDLSNRIRVMEADAEGELAQMLSIAAFALSDIEIDEENDFEDCIAFAVDSIANALAHRPAAAVTRKKVAHPGIDFRWDKGGKTGYFRL